MYPLCLSHCQRPVTSEIKKDYHQKILKLYVSLKFQKTIAKPIFFFLKTTSRTLL